MTRWTWLALCLLLVMPVAALAAPAGKVVIAQGVDPTTLDIMNQQETPASVIGQHIYEKLNARRAARPSDESEERVDSEE